MCLVEVMAVSSNCVPRVEVLGHWVYSYLEACEYSGFSTSSHTWIFTVSFLAFLMAIWRHQMVIVICSKLSPILHSLLSVHILYWELFFSCNFVYVLGVLSRSHLSATQIHTCILNTAPLAGCLAPSLGVFWWTEGLNFNVVQLIKHFLSG